jgi:hypothetical protein
MKITMSRIFEGIEITEEFVDDLVSEWHDNIANFTVTLKEFIMSNTGFSDHEYEVWVRTGSVPLA